MVFNPHAGYEAIALVLEGDTAQFGQFVCYAEADIVACGSIFTAYIAETGNEMEHAGLLFCRVCGILIKKKLI